MKRKIWKIIYASVMIAGIVLLSAGIHRITKTDRTESGEIQQESEPETEPVQAKDETEADSGREETGPAGGKKSHELRNVMYYGDWSIWSGQGEFYPKDIPADQLTHLNFAFLYFDQDGNLKFTDRDAAVGAPVGMDVTWGDANAGILNAFQELRAENPNLKIGVSVGGWSKSNEFARMAARKESRENFVSNMMKFIQYANMDFIDIDWEYPGIKQYREPDTVDNINDEGTIYNTAEDKENYVELMEELRDALDELGREQGRYYELSCALPVSRSKLANGIDIEKLFKIIDFGNIMTYDMRGAWDATSGHQAALYGNPKDPQYSAGLSVDQTVQYFIDKGAPPEKIVIGCAFYSRGWNRVEKDGPVNNMPGLFADAEKNAKDADQTPSFGAVNELPLKSGDGGRAGGVWSYRSLDSLRGQYPGLKEYWDDVAKAPYLYDEESGMFFTYDNAESVRLKAEYAVQNGLGGCISWMASQDKPTDTGKRDELTRAIKEGLFGSEPVAENEAAVPKLNVTAEVEKKSPEDGSGSQGYEIRIQNLEKEEETGEVLQALELAYKSVKNPRVYLTLKNEETLSAAGYGCGEVMQEGKEAVIDLSPVYDYRLIAPGNTVTFQLKSSLPDCSVSNIEKIELSQRMTAGGPELGRLLIWENPGKSNDGDEKKTAAESPEKPAANPKQDHTESETETENCCEADWDASTVYNGGEVVIYEGRKYRARWWTQGETPANEEGGAWKEIK